MSAPAATLVRSPLSDGAWHRPHPLTPLLRGGFVLIVVIGIVVANLRERLVELVLPLFDPQLRAPAGRSGGQPGDPVDWIVDNDLYLLAALAVLAVLVVLVVGFTLSWRFHTFRVTGELVEVRHGILFRSHRRAPLDRVQGVNLTRPLLARLIGLATLEVVGAGADGSVKLEYLRTGDAETVRADILRLASGRRLAEETADAGGAARLLDTVARGVSGIVDGPETPVAAADSVVDIPARRLIAAHLLRVAPVAVVLVAIGGVLVALDRPVVLVIAVPIVLGMIAYETRRLVRALRYAIAPTGDGVRITFGLFTTVTETIPPGRIHAVEIAQPVLWRAAGWWEIRMNRVDGRRRGERGNDHVTTALPVGTIADTGRVLALLLPQLPAPVRELAVTAAAGAAPGFETTPRRAWFLHPLSWRRAGVLLTGEVLLLRRGLVRRRLVIVPLARMQGIAVSQGPVARGIRVAGIRAHTVSGPVGTHLAAVDRDVALRVWEQAAGAAVTAARADRSHRWASEAVDAAAEEDA